MRPARARRIWKPLLKRNPDLVSVGPCLYMKPLHHVLRVLFIGPTGDPRVFAIGWTVMEMCYPHRDFLLNLGGQVWIEGWPGFDYRTIYDLPDDEIGALTADMAEAEALPKLRSLGTLEAFLAHAVAVAESGRVGGGLGFAAKYCLDIATGNIDDAKETARKLGPRWAKDEPRDEWDDRAKRLRMREVTRLLEADDWAGLGMLLRQFELYTAEQLKASHLYEPTPFPFELGQRIEYADIAGGSGGWRP